MRNFSSSFIIYHITRRQILFPLVSLFFLPFCLSYVVEELKEELKEDDDDDDKEEEGKEDKRL